MVAERPNRFATTRWSLVVAAANRDATATAGAALAELCEGYWYPLYAFARRGGHNAEDARDLTQSFFAELLEKDYVRQADRDRGRFRTFLIAAFRHHIGRQKEKASALKRGGGTPPLSLDYELGERRYAVEPVSAATPETLYERRWALTVLERVHGLLRDEYGVSGKEALYAALEPLLLGERAGATYRAIGESLGMSEAAVKVAAHRLKRRYAAKLREAVAETVARPEDVDRELQHLLQAVQSA